MQKKDEEPLLCASFCADSILKVELREVKKLIAVLPEFKLITDGLTLKFLLDSKGCRAILECKAESITYTYYFTKESRRSRNTNLVKFISIMAHLKSAYDVKLNRLYEIIVDAIGDTLFVAAEGKSENRVQVERIEELGRSNFVLAKVVGALSKENAGFRHELEVLRQFLGKMLEKFSGESGSESKDVLARLGLEKEFHDELLKLLSKD